MTASSKKQKLLYYSGGALLALMLSACTGETAPSSSSLATSSSEAAPPSSSSVSSAVPSSTPSISSSSAPSFGDVGVGAAAFAAGGDCASCHTDNGDGTFGGLVPFNAVTMNRGASVQALASYISGAMPSTSPSLCQADCADNTAAYLWSFKGSTSASSEPTGTGSSSSLGDNGASTGLGYKVLPNGRGGVNYEPGGLDESVGFDRSVSLAAFEQTLYPHLRDSGCGSCHNSAVAPELGGNQAPMHTDSDVNLAHEYALTRVNFKDPRNSKFVVRMEIDRHQCPSGASCASAGRDMLAAVTAWKDRIEHMLPETPRGVPAGTMISESQMEQWIAADKATLSADELKYTVYTSMHELHNEGLTADELDIVRVGLSKALNSVARWAPELVNPEDVNGMGILYKFDIRDYWGYNQGVEEIFFGGSDDDLAFTQEPKVNYKGEVVDESIQRRRYNFTNETVRDDDHAWAVWERVLHGNVEGANVNGSNIPPYIDGFKGARKTNAAGEYVDINAFEWVEAAQLIYTLTRPDVYNAIMSNPFYADEMERNLEVDISEGMDSYDYMITFDAITVDSRLTWRAKRPNDGWYWKTWDIFTGQLASGRDRSIFDVYDDPTGRDIRFPWWANPIPKFVKSLSVADDNEDFTFVASLNQTFGNGTGDSGFGFLGGGEPGCDNQTGAVQGFGNCRHYTGKGGAMQAASEIIYSLENGLQGYYLTGGFNQRRIDAFTNIVRDPRILREAGDNIGTATGYSYSNPGGNGGFRGSDPRLNLGSSCIGCHADGMNRASNDLRLWMDKAPERLPKGPYGVDGWIDDAQTVARVKELYKEDAYMKDQIEKDRQGFLAAMADIKDAMMWGADKNVYVEPIIWTVEYVQYEKYQYPQTTSN
ncbi:MAG TPA: c-type cytochrome [Marinagarivorans sp.]